MIEKEISNPVGGAIVYWTCGNTNRQRFLDMLKGHGLDELLPAERSDASALKAAIAEIVQVGDREDKANKCSIEHKVQPHLKQGVNGYDVTQVRRFKEKNETRHLYGLKLDKSGDLETTHGYCNEVGDIKRLFAYYKGDLTGGAVAAFLVKTVGMLGGVCLRDAGGIYWLSNRALIVYRSVVARVEEAGGKDDAGNDVNRCYIARTPMDHDTCRAVRDALVAKIKHEAELLAKELVEGTLGEEALENRRKHLNSLADQVNEYEGILGEGLDRLKDVLEALQGSMAIGAMQSMGA